jgi:hypothetical protein
MKSSELERQARLQAQAELAERQQLPASGDPGLDSYRLVIRALRQPLATQLPANFAAQVAARVGFSEERSSLDDWLMTGLMLVLAVTGLFYIRPVMAGIIGQFHFQLPSLPWPLLGAAAVSVAVAWALDRGALSRHHDR